MKPDSHKIMQTLPLQLAYTDMICSENNENEIQKLYVGLTDGNQSHLEWNL